MATAPAPINERMIPTLNAFSASVNDLCRQYADGTKGTPMVLDGSWQHFKTVKNRFKDKCNEYSIEDYRTTDNKPGDLNTATQIFPNRLFGTYQIASGLWPSHIPQNVFGRFLPNKKVFGEMSPLFGKVPK